MLATCNRVLTTHVGSLPRSAVVADMLLRREQGADFDEAEFDSVMTSAVIEVVRLQKEAGVDLVSAR